MLAFEDRDAAVHEKSYDKVKSKTFRAFALGSEKAGERMLKLAGSIECFFCLLPLESVRQRQILSPDVSSQTMKHQN